LSTELDSENRSWIRRRFLAVDTSNIADVLDELGYMDQSLHPDFIPYPADNARLAGFAYTIRGQTTPFPLGGDAEKMQACQELSSDEISVWAGDGIGTCYFGELIAVGMKERGCVGAVVDGGVRDVKWFKHHGFPVYARYRSPTQSIGRWKVTAWQVPVFVKGATSRLVRIEPSDLVVADADGAIVVPRTVISEVLEKAEALTTKEACIREELEKGLPLADALEKYGHV